MSISGVSSSGGFDASKMASYMMKKSDANGDGSLDKSEFVKASTDRGISETDATAKFDSIDKNKTGKISQSDLESDIKQSVAQGSTSGVGGPGDGDGDGGKKAGGASKAGGSSQSSSATKTYEKADTNKDGKVSDAEQLVYDLKALMTAMKDKAKTDDAAQVSNQDASSSNAKVGSNIDVTV